MDLLWSFIYTLVYTQCKSQGTKSKQGEGRLPFAILESSLNNCLLLDCAAQYELRSRHFPHAKKNQWFCFQAACALGGKLTHTGNGHDYCCLCSAMAPERLCRTDACLRARRGCVLRLTFCGVGTWSFVPTCHPPSLFPKGPSLPPRTTPVQEAQHLREVISTSDSGWPRPRAVWSGSETPKEVRGDIRWGILRKKHVCSWRKPIEEVGFSCVWHSCYVVPGVVQPQGGNLESYCCCERWKRKTKSKTNLISSYGASGEAHPQAGSPGHTPRTCCLCFLSGRCPGNTLRPCGCWVFLWYSQI